ncbi:MAG: GNAT family N-acetyltransferase [Candidatus Shapirobacteria bacterium]
MNSLISRKLKIIIIDAPSLTKKQIKDKKGLQALCFGSLDPQEIEEDFCHPETAHVLAYLNKQLSGWAGIHLENTIYNNKKIKLGGFGICTHPKHRQKGIASKVSQKAMGYLKQQKCDLAFLSIDPSKKGPKELHQKTGFVSLPNNFSWISRSGKRKLGKEGMIAPLSSPKIFKQILNGKEILHIAKGYW